MTPKDVITNKSFCPLPWTGFMYNFDGSIKNCIRNPSVIGNIKDAGIEEIMHGDINTSTQRLMLDRQPGPTCHNCYNLEKDTNSFDIISDRIFYIRELKQVSLDTYKTGQFDLKTIDVRWSNLCNFSCVYCSPEFSSKWADETGIHYKSPTVDQINELREYIFKHAKNLKHVYLAGGEPLLMKENLELLDLLDPNTNIRINTNLSKVDTQVFERICQFKNVHWIVSVETLAEEYEYIRFGGVWENFLENLAVIKKLPHKVTFNMLYFILNYRSLFDCVDHLNELGFHNNAFVIGPVLTPEYLNVRHLPAEVLHSVSNMLSDRINESPGFLLENSYRNLLAYIQTPMVKNLEDSFFQLALLDKARNLDSSKIFKDLYKLKGN